MSQLILQINVVIWRNEDNYIPNRTEYRTFYSQKKDFNRKFHIELFSYIFQYEFASSDSNKNDYLDADEIKNMGDEREPCMVALLQACDYDGEPGISRTEWTTCFPSQLEGNFTFYILYSIKTKNYCFDDIKNVKQMK